MAIQRVQYANVDHRARARKMLLVLGAMLCIALGGWLFQGFAGTATFLVLAIVAYGIWFQVKKGEQVARATEHLRNAGIHADLRVGDGDVLLIDSRKKMFAFVDTTLRTYDLVTGHDVLAWSGVGDRLTFETRNVNNPVYKIQVRSKQVQELWMARISAVMAGQ
ncbi:hypothetical protein [Burkholderia sp. Ac-20365]|uniref:hypothetical protein n=1 Tax=Burkholderia sp. Ac-20365 TaxID=2703897 RepID=UPI00197B2116|nr:hypothetical protein [Burkholderia sp. Ac-20365]MBN3761149.1 hypothetical protein [Burkholderia sp. Ac-20365]